MCWIGKPPCLLDQRRCHQPLPEALVWDPLFQNGVCSSGHLAAGEWSGLYRFAGADGFSIPVPCRLLSVVCSTPGQKVPPWSIWSVSLVKLIIKAVVRTKLHQLFFQYHPKKFRRNTGRHVCKRVLLSRTAAIGRHPEPHLWPILSCIFPVGITRSPFVRRAVTRSLQVLHLLPGPVRNRPSMRRGSPVRVRICTVNAKTAGNIISSYGVSGKRCCWPARSPGRKRAVITRLHLLNATARVRG